MLKRSASIVASASLATRCPRASSLPTRRSPARRWASYAKPVFVKNWSRRRRLRRIHWSYDAYIYMCALQNAAPGQTVADRLRRLEAIRRIAPVEKDLDIVLSPVNLAVRRSDRDCPQMLDAVDAARRGFAVEGVLRRLLREIELIPFHVGIVGTVIGVDVSAVLPAAQVIADRHDYVGRRRDLEAQAPKPAIDVFDLDLSR